MTTQLTVHQISGYARVEHLRVLAALEAGSGFAHLIGYDYDNGHVGDQWELDGFISQLVTWGCWEGDALTVRGRWLLEWLRGRHPGVCPSQPGPNVVIRYYAEPMGGGRGQMRRDVIVDGKMVDSTLDGTPAPIATVQQHERVVQFKVVGG